MIAISAVSASEDASDVISASDVSVQEVQSIANDENILSESTNDVQVSVSTNSTPYNENATIEVSVVDKDISNESTVDIYVDGSFLTNLTLNSEGKASYVIPAETYEAGNYYVMATYTDSNNTLLFGGSLLNITKVTPIVSIENVTVRSGETVTIPLNVTDDKGKRISGGVIVTLFWENDSLSKYVEVDGGKGSVDFDISKLVGLFSNRTGNSTFDISKLLNGTNVTFDLSSIFNGTNMTFDLSSIFNGTNITVDISKYVNGTNTTSIDLSTLLNGTNMTFDFSKIFNGTNTTFDISGLLNGTIDFSSLFNRSDSNTDTKADTNSNILGIADSSILGNSTFNITGLTNMSGNRSSFNISDLLNYFINGNNNTITFNYLFGPGVYNMTVTYLGNRNYNKAENTTAKLIVTPRAIISAEDVVMYYKNGTRYVVNLTDADGKPLANETVTITINGASYNRTTNENGTASIAINLEPGNYTVSASYGFGHIVDTSVENNITVLSTITNNKNLVKYFRNATQFVITILDGQGNPAAAGETVTFNINGVFYERKANESGQVKLNINLEPGEYIITADYKGCRVSNNITVLSILNASDLTKAYKDSTPFKVQVLDGQGKPLANAVVTFNINGVFYNRTSDSDGIAKLNINLQKGEYIITSSYNGLSISNTIIVVNGKS